MGVLTQAEIEVQLLGQLGTPALAHIGRVGDVAQMPAVIPAFKTDLDRVIASGCCAVVRISIVEG